jgi:hypothetical protein
MERRIKRLLALAEDERGNEHERELAAKQAERLMLRWGIQRAKLEASLSDDRSEQIVVKYTQPFPKLFIKARMSLAHSICLGMGNLKLWIAGNVCAVMGFESDVDRALTLIQSLLIQNDLSLAEWWAHYPDRRFMTSQQALLARRQFIFGFGATVRNRLTEMRSEEITAEDRDSGTPGTALVLADRGALVDAEYDAKYGKGMRRGRSLKGSAHGGAAGRAAGARANLGQTGIGGGPRGVLGG